MVLYVPGISGNPRLYTSLYIMKTRTIYYVILPTTQVSSSNEHLTINVHIYMYMFIGTYICKSNQRAFNLHISKWIYPMQILKE